MLNLAFFLAIGATSVTPTAVAMSEVGSDKPTKEFTPDMAYAGAPRLREGHGELYATIHTSMGDIIVRLFQKDAPNTVANFVALARGTREWLDPKTRKWVKRPLYRGVICHRVIPNFMIQCGDPEGSGAGGPGYSFADEFKPNLRHDRPGILSMANRGPNTNGSQFFITEVAAPNLDDHHTVFGEVVKNLDLVGKIARVKSGMDNRPEQDVVIKTIDVYRSDKTPK
jgi:peptidyl-prolyl cis-trans isomerase A (cyclophilin A)